MKNELDRDFQLALDFDDHPEECRNRMRGKSIKEILDGVSRELRKMPDVMAAKKFHELTSSEARVQ